MTALCQIQPYLRATNGKVIAAFEDGGRFMISVEPALFYPQGGGQKGDRGKLTTEGGTTVVIVDTIKDALSSDGRALCVVDGAHPIATGDDVQMEIDWLHRHAQMRLHSIVHLHHCLMERVVGHALSTPSTSDLQSDGTAYNRYDTDIPEEIAHAAFDVMKALIVDGAIITVRGEPNGSRTRYWECLEFSIPCGGTHLSDIREIGGFSMAFGKRKGKPKVSFTLC